MKKILQFLKVKSLSFLGLLHKIFHPVFSHRFTHFILLVSLLYFGVGSFFTYTGAGPMWVPLVAFMVAVTLAYPPALLLYLKYLINGKL